MSVSSEVTRIEADRNTIRNTLLAWGLAQATDNLDVLADALASVVNRGAVAVELDEGETYTVPAGYHNGSGAVTNGVRAGRLEPTTIPATSVTAAGYMKIPLIHTWIFTVSRLDAPISLPSAVPWAPASASCSQPKM